MKTLTVKRPDARKLYKVGDIVELNYGIKPQKISGIPSHDRVDVIDPKKKINKTLIQGGGIGIPLSWVKGKQKKVKLAKKK